MSRKVSYSAILVFWFLVIFAPWYFWEVVKNPPRRDVLTFDDRGRPTVEIDKGSVLAQAGLTLLMFVGGAVGVYRKARKEGAVAPLKIAFGAICSSCALIGAGLLSELGPESVFARYSERQSFRYVVFIFIFSVATIALLALALREQRRVKSTATDEQIARPIPEP